SIARGFDYAERHGVIDAAVLASLDINGKVLDPTQRIWAKAEYLRALALRPGSEQQLLQQLRSLEDKFLHAGGWRECLDATGAVSRHDMPSTTPYHLATCLQGLDALA
ncbi:MAG: N-acylglucosamine 2-epimerase, partial [Pseudomonas sp.]